MKVLKDLYASLKSSLVDALWTCFKATLQVRRENCKYLNLLFKVKFHR